VLSSGRQGRWRLAVTREKGNWKLALGDGALREWATRGRRMIAGNAPLV
jgi:hypothetical protein